MTERQSKIVKYAVTFLKSQLSADAEVEDMLLGEIGESDNALTVEKELEQIEQLLDARQREDDNDKLPGYVVVDTDEHTIVIDGSKGECDDWTYNHNGKVTGNGGDACYTVMPKTQADREGYKKPNRKGK